MGQTNGGRAPSPAAKAAAAPSFRHAAYADLDHVWADTASTAVFPTRPADCGPIVCPVLISRSHSLPYLEVLRHLAARGYRVVLQVDTRNAEWCARAYGAVFEIERVPASVTDDLWSDFDQKIEDVAEHGDEPATMARLLGTMGSDFATAMYAWTKARAEELKPALYVIDTFYGFCADVCDELGIPYAGTTSGLIPGMAETPWMRPLYTQDGMPTTLRLTLPQRLHAATVEPATALWAILPALREAARVRKALGVTAPRAGQASPADRFRGRLTLVNTFWGHETARPLPASVRLIGPVRSHGAASAAQALEGRFAEFVAAAEARARGRQQQSDGASSAARVVLLSFGQNCSVSQERLAALLNGLRRLLARGVIDGAVWSVSLTPEDRLVAAGLRDPALAPPDLILVDTWVPQKALLEHPSVAAFVSHGGTESSSECFFAAKPVLSVPHFSDQPRNSRLIEEAGAGIVLPKRTLTAEGVERALERLVGPDEGASFVAAARRLRSIAIASGRLSTERAADELEVVLHFGDDHLQTQGDAMGWMKRNNVDLYLAMAAISVGCVAGAAALVRAAVGRRG